MGEKKAEVRYLVRYGIEVGLLTVGGGALVMWGYAIDGVASAIFCGMLTFSFLWQWFRGRDYELAPSIGRLMLLAVLAAATVALFLLGR